MGTAALAEPGMTRFTRGGGTPTGARVCAARRDNFDPALLVSPLPLLLVFRPLEAASLSLSLPSFVGGEVAGSTSGVGVAFELIPLLPPLLLATITDDEPRPPPPRTTRNVRIPP